MSFFFFFSSRRRHTRFDCDWSSDVCSSDLGTQQYLIRGIGLLRSPQDIGNIVVAARGGTPILVKDLGHVTLSAVPRQGVVGPDRDDDVDTGIVLMRKGENASWVLQGI